MWPGWSLYHWQERGWGTAGHLCSCGGCLAEATEGTDRMGQRLGWAGDQPLSLEAPELQRSCLCITCILASFP